MTKKELKEIYYIDKEIKMWRSKLDEVTEIQSPNLTGLPGSNMTSDTVSRLAVQKDEINAIISGLLVKLEVKKRDMMEYIESISDSVVRQIIQYRYIDLLTWVKISEKIYGRIDRESSVRMIHDRFLKK